MSFELDRKSLFELLPWLVNDPNQNPFNPSKPLGSGISPPIKAHNAAKAIIEGKKEESPHITTYWVYYKPKENLPDVLGLIGTSGTAKSRPEHSVIPHKKELSEEFQKLPNITLEISSDSLSVNIQFNRDTLPVDVYELEVGNQSSLPLQEIELGKRDGTLYANLQINSNKYLVLATGNTPFAALRYEKQTFLPDKSPEASVVMMLSRRLFERNISPIETLHSSRALLS